VCSMRTRFPVRNAMVDFPVEDVVVGDRARGLDESVVDSLAESIGAIGLLHAVTLTPHGHLIAGLHRLEAVRRLGWETIPANVVDGEQVELVEIDENLIRAELTVLERAEHLQRRREIYETLHPESIHGNGPGRGNTGPQEDRAPGFARATADKVGQSASTIRRQVAIAEGLPKEVRDLIRQSPVADNGKELRKLAKLPQQEQISVAQRIACDDVKTVWEAQKAFRLAQAEAKPAKSGVSVFHCSVSELRDYVAAQSVDLILTDPPYGRDAIGSYGELAEFAEHALTPTGSLLVMTGQFYLPQVMQQLSGLTYQWTLAYIVDAGGSPLAPTVQRRVNSWWKPILWFTRNGYEGPVHGDLIRSGPKAKDSHAWQQDAEGMEFLVQAFSRVGETVCDPFLGTGTTGVAALQLGRQFVGADVDEDALMLARARLAET